MEVKEMYVLNTPQKLLEFMSENIKYGYIDKNNQIHDGNDLDNFGKDYILQSPQQVFENKVGVCWDQTYFESYIFSTYIKYPFSLFYIEQKNRMSSTHTFLVYKRMNRYYYFENSYEMYRGIHEVKDEADAINMVVNNMRKDQSDDGVQIRKIYNMQFGLNCLEFMNYCIKYGIKLDSIVNESTNQLYQYSDSFDDVKDVVNLLSDDEKHYISPNGSFKDSPYSIYRKVYKNGNENMGFIELYSFKDKSKAYIAIAVSPKYRGKGLSKLMTNEAINSLSNKKNLKRLIWGANKNNKISNKLANELNFNKFDSDDVDNEYELKLTKHPLAEYLHNNGNEPVLNSIEKGTNICDESSLSTEERNTLKDSDFGIPHERKYPLINDSHVLQAIRYFNKCDPKYEKELADNIIKRSKELKININVGGNNRLSNYLH